MHIEHILEQGSGVQNEDCLIMDKNIYGVFDGATSLDATVFEYGRTGGQLASSLAADVFLRDRSPLYLVGVGANEAIRFGMEQRHVDVSRRCSLWSTSAAVARVGDGVLDWFQTGDSQLIFVYADGSFKVAAKRLDHDCATLNMIREKGRFHPKVHQQIGSVRERMNLDYGVLNGEPVAADFFQSGTESLDGIETILLFTDGLDLPCAYPEPVKDYSALVRMACESGLCGLRDHVRTCEAADPDITCYPRFKCHDDIAAIAIRL